jgi:quinol monooxygenase YgiN
MAPTVQRRTPLRALPAAVLATAAAAACACLLSPQLFVTFRPRQQRLAASRAGLRAGSENPWDSLIQLTETMGEAMEDAQEMFGGQGGKGQLESMEFSSLGMGADGNSVSGIMQTMQLRASAGSEKKLARQVNKFIAAARTDKMVTTATAQQNAEDPCDFMLLLRYPSMPAMKAHQESAGFKDILGKMEPQLAKPIGLYLMDEQNGILGMPRHPFGPGGEGGRDDAIYSSRNSVAR